jgi:basic membrane protein A
MGFKIGDLRPGKNPLFSQEEKPMSKKLFAVLGVLIMVSMVLSACATPTAAPTEAPVAPTEAPAAPTEVPPTMAPKLLFGEVTDMGGVDDRSFNALGWKGLTDAQAQLGVDAKYLESTQQSDYAKNIQQFLNEKAAMIVTVGYALGVDTATSARGNPDTKYAIVDYSYPDCFTDTAVEGKDCGSKTVLPNVVGLTFQTDEAALLAGMLAAGTSKTGVVGTFGGMNFPTVSIFMKGLEAGVKYYNQLNGTNVKILGWDTCKNDGTFTGNFSSTDDARKITESMAQEGADVFMGVGGPIGQGAAAYCMETKSCTYIGVDADWYESVPQYKDIYLTSVLKKIDLAVLNTAKSVVDGTFKGSTINYTIKDGGVDIAPSHDLASLVTPELQAQVDQAKADLISGKITVDGVLACPAQ